MVFATPEEIFCIAKYTLKDVFVSSHSLCGVISPELVNRALLMITWIIRSSLKYPDAVTQARNVISKENRPLPPDFDREATPAVIRDA